jgi:hypothetical protein
MSIRQNGKIIAGATQYHPDLFDWKWADHELNDISWLRADTFSWQSGAVYQAAYQQLADDIDGKILQSETVSGTTIQFYLADDGHKICPASQESNVMAIYNATGVAWYYIIDTTNERFKLPRTQYGVTGLRDTVGNYVEPGLPNITGSTTLRGADLGINNTSVQTGCFEKGTTFTNGKIVGLGDTTTSRMLGFNASGSNSIYGNSTTVQPPATQMYLYFYVGSFTQTALENTAGLNAELFNGKVDTGHQVIEFQEPTAANNYTWYRKYADGWVEQGGLTNADTGATGTVVLPVAMANTNYTVVVGNGYTTTNMDYTAWCGATNRTTTGFIINVKGYGGSGTSYGCCWQVSGIAA